MTLAGGFFCFSAPARTPRRPPGANHVRTRMPAQRHGRARRERLSMSTIAFTVCFAVWTIFSIIGIRIKDELGLTETAVRPADRHADPDRHRWCASCSASGPTASAAASSTPRRCWPAALATFLLAFATTYPQMLLAGARRRPRRRLLRGRRRLCLALLSRRASRAPRSASSASAMSARRSPSSSRPSSCSPAAGRPWR